MGHFPYQRVHGMTLPDRTGHTICRTKWVIFQHAMFDYQRVIHDKYKDNGDLNHRQMMAKRFFQLYPMFDDWLYPHYIRIVSPSRW